MAELQEGESASARLVVAQSDLASALQLEPQDAYPEVFATSRMIALMEVASGRLLQPHLKAGELSVGVTLDVSHTAPTPVGETVVAQSRYVGRDGKLFVFEVSARDGVGEIGKGTHKRAIIATERLLAGAARRRVS
jgi:fluoroacetyl-CoA thioesterase